MPMEILGLLGCTVFVEIGRRRDDHAQRFAELTRRQAAVG
jgi:hypothetical protein